MQFYFLCYTTTLLEAQYPTVIDLRAHQYLVSSISNRLDKLNTELQF